MRSAARLAALLALSCGSTEVAGRGRPPLDPRADVSGIPVAVSPVALMRPGAVKAIQDALAARRLLPQEARPARLDAVTQEALRAFQRSAGLAATGLPGYATVEALGLPLDEIFHHRGGEW